jgi:hypothetical protein
MRFLGSEVNLVLGREDPSVTPLVAVELDGAQHRSFAVDRQDLFQLWTGSYGEHELVLRIEGAGAEAYAFTFGS